MAHFIIALRIITLLIVLIVPVLAQDDRKDEVTVKGEVIDLACFIINKDAGRGPDHKECALKCAKNGTPLGLLEDGTGTVYYTIKMKNKNNANDMMMQFIAEKVLIKGKITERGGTKLLLIDMIEKAN
ncbi:MAG: hypothetical protein HY276_01160 [Ignavibacteriales bacterium]|nr:hypothetical protein [Ignavibacteriales bacterium]